MSITNLINNAAKMLGSRPALHPESRPCSPDVSAAPPDVRRLIRDGRYCQILASECELPFDDASRQCAWQALEHAMALVPDGETWLATSTVNDDPDLTSCVGDLVLVESLYLDRTCVTNDDYAKFVQSGAYSDANLWPANVLPNVLQFVDTTGRPGPKDWVSGSPPPEKLDHPVVGICWYEANAYATWAGKRLPTAEQWQRGGTWSRSHSGSSSELRYPWGNAFDPGKANLWSSRVGDTVPVHAYQAGSTPNGVQQLVGNVWEWIDAQFCPMSTSGEPILLDEAMAETRGAAFDTYFHSQATCQFRTGKPLMFRGANVGFRCCISENTLPVTPDLFDTNNPRNS